MILKIGLKQFISSEKIVKAKILNKNIHRNLETERREKE